MYFASVCAPPNEQTQRESHILQVFVPQNEETQRESCIFTRVCVPPNKETQRESRILQGFVCLRVQRHSVNLVFYEGLCAFD